MALLALSVGLLASVGCATGPMTGTKYFDNSFTRSDPDWGYWREVREFYAGWAWGPDDATRQATREGRLRLGMSPEDVRAAWCHLFQYEPRKSVLATAIGVIESWTIESRNLRGGFVILTFQDRKLVGIQ